MNLYAYEFTATGESILAVTARNPEDADRALLRELRALHMRGALERIAHEDISIYLVREDM